MTVTDPQASPVGVDGTVVLDNVPGGRAFVPAGTPLTRLNYYDGKFLRAADLDLEQRAHRALVAFSNQAGGPGVVRGFDVTAAAGASLRLSPGLALDADGRVLFLPDTVEATVADLLAAAQAPQPGDDGGNGGGPGGSPSFAPCEIATAGPEVPTVGGLQLYLVCLGHVDGLCGNEEVFGRLCDDACVTATDRPYRLDGVVLSLRPLVLGRPLVTSTAVSLGPVHLRSRVASAWFAGEDAAGGSLLSSAGLASNVWCLGAPALVGDCVPLAVLGWQAGSIAFLDQWTARRERMEPPPRLYWAGRMEMRPWPAFLAQVLQFQCQLAGLPAAPPGGGGGTDPCTDAKSLLDQSTALIQELLGKLDDPEVTQAAGELVGKVLDVLNAPAPATVGRVLIDGGIVELPAAGYLPVDPNATSPLRDQVQSLMGAGVDLRFCAVRRDQIAHELERAQHMQRISLLRGLDDPSRLEEVDILVPDGEVEEQATPGTGAGFAVDMAIGFAFDKVDGAAIAPFAAAAAAAPGVLPMRGAGRFDRSGGRITAHTAVLGVAGPNVRLLLQALARLGAQEPDPIRRLEGATFEASEGEVDVAAVATEIAERAVAHRARRSNAKVISLAEAPAQELLAVWSTASVWGDPFALAVGASVPFQVTVDAFVPAAPSALVELRVDGWAKRLPARGVTGTVHFQVTGTTVGDTVNLRGAPDPGGTFEGEVALRQELVDGRPRIVLLLDEGTLPAAFVAWTSGPVAAEGAIVRATEPGQDPATITRIVDARALEGTGVAQAGEPHHDAAIAALQLLKGAEPDEPGFFDTAVSQLFGGGSPGGTTVEVRPTVDWVLFRRRRREDCSGEVELPPPPPSAVAAWLAVAESADEAAKHAELLRQGAGGEVPWVPISTVEFEAGTAELRTPASSFRQAWQVAGGGSRIAFVGHAATGAGVTLGHSRAVALTGAVAPIAALDPGAAVDDVLDPPAAQMLAATEGSTFFVTYRPKEEPVARDCVEVMVLPDVSTAAQKLFAEAVAGGEPSEADAREAAAGVEHMGEVVVLPGGALDESSTDAAVAAYKEFVEAAAESEDPRFPGAAFGWIAEDWASTNDVDEGRSAIAELADRLGVDLRDVPVLPFDHEDRCPLRLYVLMRQG